jgi:hypothetical protein
MFCGGKILEEGIEEGRKRKDKGKMCERSKYGGKRKIHS